MADDDMARPPRVRPPARPDRPPARPDRPPARPDRPPARPDRPPARPDRPPARPDRPPARPDRPAPADDKKPAPADDKKPAPADDKKPAPADDKKPALTDAPTKIQVEHALDLKPPQKRHFAKTSRSTDPSVVSVEPITEEASEILTLLAHKVGKTTVIIRYTDGAFYQLSINVTA